MYQQKVLQVLEEKIMLGNKHKKCQWLKENGPALSKIWIKLKNHVLKLD